MVVLVPDRRSNPKRQRLGHVVGPQFRAPVVEALDVEPSPVRGAPPRAM